MDACHRLIRLDQLIRKLYPYRACETAVYPHSCKPHRPSATVMNLNIGEAFGQKATIRVRCNRVPAFRRNDRRRSFGSDHEPDDESRRFHRGVLCRAVSDFCDTSRPIRHNPVLQSVDAHANEHVHQDEHPHCHQDHDDCPDVNGAKIDADGSGSDCHSPGFGKFLTDGSLDSDGI